MVDTWMIIPRLVTGCHGDWFNHNYRLHNEASLLHFWLIISSFWLSFSSQICQPLSMKGKNGAQGGTNNQSPFPFYNWVWNNWLTISMSGFGSHKRQLSTASDSQSGVGLSTALAVACTASICCSVPLTLCGCSRICSLPFHRSLSIPVHEGMPGLASLWKWLDKMTESDHLVGHSTSWSFQTTQNMFTEPPDFPHCNWQVQGTWHTVSSEIQHCPSHLTASEQGKRPPGAEENWRGNKGVQYSWTTGNKFLRIIRQDNVFWETSESSPPTYMLA